MVADDVTSVTTTPVDPRRPVIGLPSYGGCWVADPGGTAWGGRFRTDPRARGIAGLGAWAGIVQQDLIADAAAAQAGAQDIAAQRIRHLSMGLAAARSLWNRRVPVDDVRRMTLFGPALRRMVTTTGTVRDAVAGADRPLSASSLFSSASRDVCCGLDQPAPPQWVPRSPTHEPWSSANTVAPPPPPRAPGRLPHADLLAKAVATPPRSTPRSRRGSRPGPCRPPGSTPLPTASTARATPPRWSTTRHPGQGGDRPAARRQAGPVPHPDRDPRPARRSRHTEHQLTGLLGKLDGPDESQDLLRLGAGLHTQQSLPQSSPIDLALAAGSIAAAVDPTVARPFLVDRVLSTISGVDDQPLAPPELSPDLDLPAWTFLRDHAPDWLLPGGSSLKDNDVVGVQTNPAFIDAFLVGLNTQTLGELRFRNIPIVTGATPMRQFWSRTNPAAETYDDDIIGVHGWADTSDLGDTTHQNATAHAATDLVLVLRTGLFRRFPRTLVYLTPAALDASGQPTFTADPDFAARALPVFQGNLAADISFFGFDLSPAAAAGYWAVLEEAPHGVRFYNTAPDPAKAGEMTNADDGAQFASASFADPVRVLIAVRTLLPAAHL